MTRLLIARGFTRAAKSASEVNSPVFARFHNQFDRLRADAFQAGGHRNRWCRR